MPKVPPLRAAAEALVLEHEAALIGDIRVAAERVRVGDCPGSLGAGAPHPVIAAAWLLHLRAWLARTQVAQATGRQARGRHAKPKLRPPAFTDHPELDHLDEADCVRLIEKADKALREWRSNPDSEGTTSTASPGAAPLIQRWQQLQDQMWYVRQTFEDFTRNAPAEGLYRDSSTAGMEWWFLRDGLISLRERIAAVREALPESTRLPEHALPLDQRWANRADVFLKDLEGKFGVSVDVRLRGHHEPSSPPAIGGAYLGGITVTAGTFDELEDRAVMLGAVLGAPRAPEFRRTEWFTKAMQPKGKGKSRALAQQLVRAAKRGEFGTRGKGWRRVGKAWEFEVSRVAESLSFKLYRASFDRALGDPNALPRRAPAGAKPT